MCTHMHRATHVCTRVYIRVNTHVYELDNAHAAAQVDILVDTHVCTHVYTHVYTHAYTNVYTCVYTHAYTHVYTHASAQVDANVSNSHTAAAGRSQCSAPGLARLS